MTRVVALTGGIGTGKSSVAKRFAALGAVVVDADAIVHELQAPGAPLLAEMAAAFGPEILDARGALDRARVADLVFRDPAQRARLNAIVHPRVGAEMARRIDAARRSDTPLVVVDIPLFFESRPRDRNAARAGFDATSSCTHRAACRSTAPSRATAARARRPSAASRRSCRSTRSAHWRIT